MKARDLIRYLREVPDDFDVLFPAMDTGRLTPYCMIYPHPDKKQVWISIIPDPSTSYKDLRVDERGNFVEDDERFCPGACNGDFNE